MHLFVQVIYGQFTSKNNMKDIWEPHLAEMIIYFHQVSTNLAQKNNWNWNWKHNDPKRKF